MLERALEFIKDYEEIIEGQSTYLKDTDWSSTKRRSDRTEEYKLQAKIVTSLFTRLKYVAEEAGDEGKSHKKVRGFTDKLAKSIAGHITRINKYLKTEKWQSYEGEKSSENKADEIAFQDSLMKDVINFKEELSQLNLNDEITSISLSLFANKKISLSMRRAAEERYPEIVTFLDSRKK